MGPSMGDIYVCLQILTFNEALNNQENISLLWSESGSLEYASQWHRQDIV